MNTQHTPGPWAVIPQGAHTNDIATVYNTTKGWVSICAPAWVNFGDQKVAMANANLIAAAPDLLAIAKGSRHLAQEKLNSGYDTEYWQQILSEIDAAIAKAEGGAA